MLNIIESGTYIEPNEVPKKKFIKNTRLLKVIQTNIKIAKNNIDIGIIKCKYN